MHVFPNVEVLLLIYHTVMVSNATGERSFSTMKLVKDASRSTISQERFSSLACFALNAIS